MKVKKIILIIFLITCCGCSARYELDFTDDKITEKLSVTTERDNTTDKEYFDSYNKTITTIGEKKFYNFEITDSSEDELKLNYSYQFDTLNFSKSYIVKNCFSTSSFVSDDEKYYFLVKGSFNCLYYKYAKLDSLDIAITTNHKVLENNADEKNGDEYIWHIDLDDINDVDIRFVTEKKVEKKKEKKEYSFTPVLIITGAILALAGLIILLIAIRHKRINKI